MYFFYQNDGKIKEGEMLNAVDIDISSHYGVNG